MNKFINIPAVLMLIGMFALMLGSSWNDSAIFDEVAHIGAGYTYLKYQDSRLNPEHPPLLKDLGALPLLFLNLKENIKAQPFWTIKNVNDRQWMAGNHLLYESSNDADKILFWSRLPFMILVVIFGWILFAWVRSRYGNKVGLLALFFFATSPTFLAHSRFVTTDLGAAFGFFLGIIFFVKFLEKQDLKPARPAGGSAICLGVVLGFALLLKFSLVLLIPVYVILLFFRKIMPSEISLTPSRTMSGLDSAMARPRLEISSTMIFLFLAALIALSVIWVVYAFHVWNYPPNQQLADAKYILSDYKYQSLAKLDFWLIENRLTRPLGQYLYGFLMVARRTAGGNTAYFMGEASSQGWWTYFPVLALTKEQLGFYLLTIMALSLFLWRKIKNQYTLEAVGRFNFDVIASAVFIIFYWIASILNPLNIGVRHVLPTFPFLYFLVAKSLISGRPTSIGRRTSIILITSWMILEIILAFPYYLSYYNLLGGGLQNGYKIATDSNYDWGQDLKRLKIWVQKNNIDKIYLDYFGGGSPKYYLGDKYQGWWSSFGSPPSGSYFAVSLNSLTGSQARPVGDIQIKPEDIYSWLKNKTPVARAGSSILIFKF